MMSTGSGKSPASGVGERDTDTALYGSREAMLGADGLRVSKASGTVPATAPVEDRPSAYADAAPGAASPDESYASREASLGGSAPETAPAGGLAPEDERLPHGARPGDPDPERDWADDRK